MDGHKTVAAAGQHRRMRQRAVPQRSVPGSAGVPAGTASRADEDVGAPKPRSTNHEPPLGCLRPQRLQGRIEVAHAIRVFLLDGFVEPIDAGT